MHTKHKAQGTHTHTHTRVRARANELELFSYLHPTLTLSIPYNRRFYWYDNAPYNAPIGTGGQLWTWTPSPFTPGVASNSGGSYNSAIATGHTAGIVIGILIGLGNLYYLYKLAENQGIEILPSSISNFMPSFCKRGAGGVSVTSSNDFYSQVKSDSSQGSATYAPPL